MTVLQTAQAFTLTLALGFGVPASPASAQDRLPPIPADKLTDAQKAGIKEFERVRKGVPGGPFTPMLRSPEPMNRAAALGKANPSAAPPLMPLPR